MGLALKMRVHTAVVTQTRVPVERKGVLTNALVDVLEVELESLDGHGSMKVRYENCDEHMIADLVKQFTPDKIITYTPDL